MEFSSRQSGFMILLFEVGFLGTEAIARLAFSLIRGMKRVTKSGKANNSLRIRKGLGSGTVIGDDDLRKNSVVAIRMAAIEFDGRRMIVRDCRDDGGGCTQSR